MLQTLYWTIPHNQSESQGFSAVDDAGMKALHARIIYSGTNPEIRFGYEELSSIVSVCSTISVPGGHQSNFATTLGTARVTAELPMLQHRVG